MKTKQPKLKVGQKVRVINATGSAEKYNGKIIKIEKVAGITGFYYKSVIFDFDFDELELIKPKKVKVVSKRIVIDDVMDICEKAIFDSWTEKKLTKKLLEILEEPKKERHCKYCNESGCFACHNYSSFKQSKEIEKIKCSDICANQTVNLSTAINKINQLVEQVNKLSKEK